MVDGKYINKYISFDSIRMAKRIRMVKLDSFYLKIDQDHQKDRVEKQGEILEPKLCPRKVELNL